MYRFFFGYYTDMAKRGKHAITQTRDNKGRFAQSDDTLDRSKSPEQVLQPPFASVVELQRSYMSHFTKVLRRSDMALRQDRQLQRQMRRDPDVMSPLFQRRLSQKIQPMRCKSNRQKSFRELSRITLLNPLSFSRACWKQFGTVHPQFR